MNKVQSIYILAVAFIAFAAVAQCTTNPSKNGGCSGGACNNSPTPALGKPTCDPNTICDGEIDNGQCGKTKGGCGPEVVGKNCCSDDCKCKTEGPCGKKPKTRKGCSTC